MSVIASCGHELTEEEKMGTSIYIKEVDRYGERVACYTTLCNDCIGFYRNKGYELKTNEEINTWIGLK